jgi:hypothetical protein
MCIANRDSVREKERNAGLPHNVTPAVVIKEASTTKFGVACTPPRTTASAPAPHSAAHTAAVTQTTDIADAVRELVVVEHSENFSGTTR